MLTSRGKLIIIFFSVSIIFAYYTQWDIFYISAAFFLILMAFSYILYKLVTVQLNYKRFLPAEAYEDEIIRIRILIENKSFIPWASLYLSDYFGPEKKSSREKSIFFASLPYKSSFFGSIKDYVTKEENTL